MHDCCTKGEDRMAATLPSLQKKLLFGVIFGNPTWVHFRALTCLQSFLLKLWAWQFCDVAPSKFVTLIIPGNKMSSREKRKRSATVLKLSNNLEKNGILIIYMKTLNNSHLMVYSSQLWSDEMSLFSKDNDMNLQLVSSQTNGF